MKERLYVSLRDDNRILLFPLKDGMPGESVSFAVPGGPAAMALNPQKDRLFVGLRDSPELACFQLLPDGGLLLKTTCSLPSDPCFVGTDQSGNYILSAYYNAGQIAVHRWSAEDNSLREIQRLTTEKNAHSIKLDKSGRYAFAPHTGPNKIYCYCFDGASGNLKPAAVPFVEPPEYLEPRHLCFHPFLDRMYVINESSCRLSVYDFDRKSGALFLKQIISTLPEHTSSRSFSAELRITPDGRFLFASNRGDDSIACLSIDTATGLAGITGFAPAPKNPRTFDISGDGGFLYAAGQDSGELVTYAIDKTTGGLAELSRSYIGNCPMWVMAV
jgi:6-phosphogluconolactonase